MLTYDTKDKQILTSICRNCPDPYFAPKHPSFPHVGCCSYSPVFTLFEIYKMLKADQKEFFLGHIYTNTSNSIRPYEIVIHANVHSLYDEIDQKDKSTTEIEDTRIGFSICQFFEEGKGCTLHPPFKTSVCRSFICSTVEERLSAFEKEKLLNEVKSIKSEAEEFKVKHRIGLQKKKWNLQDNLPDLLNYLENV